MKKINCILLIDDNQDDNFFHETRIKKAGFCSHVQTVSNGREALSYLLQSEDPNQSGSYFKPEIIYLDLNMPVMNGFEFLEEYEKLSSKFKSKIVVVMLTTSLNAHDRERALSTKVVTEFQNKPLSIEALCETVKKYF